MIIISRKIYIANVGVNKSKNSRGLMSPIFGNSTFEFIPIPLCYPSFYRDLKCFNSDDSLTKYFPKGKEYLADYRVHDDPEFETYTYGDLPKNPRGSNLQNIQEGDFLFFIANLTRYENKKYFKKDFSFYFIGFFEIEKIIKNKIDIELNSERIKNNAHYKRYIEDNEKEINFFIIASSKNSRRFKKAFEVTKEFCDSCLRMKDGTKFNWDRHKTEIQCIGSSTRTARCHIGEKKDKERWNNFWNEIDIPKLI